MTARVHWRSRLGVSPETLLIAGVGRIHPQKNFHRFIDSIALLPRDMPLTAVIAGQDLGERDCLERYAASIGMEGRVRFIGKVSDARELICAADIFLLSSDYEGTPNVLLEAMAAKVACVATAVDGVCEIMTHEQNGLLAEPDAKALAYAVARILHDPQLRQRLARSGQASVARYSPASVALELWDLCAANEASRLDTAESDGHFSRSRAVGITKSASMTKNDG
jgi:glycosyltransferase involved in cell wall biosynthesis